MRLRVVHGKKGAKNMRRKFWALLCAGVLLANGACAEMAAQTDQGEIYIGENNQLTMKGAAAPLEEALATRILGAEGNVVYYLLLGNMAENGTPAYTLAQMDVSTLETTVVAENVLLAAFQPGENGVFYVTAGAPEQIQAVPTTLAGHSVDVAIERLQATQQGLVVTAGGVSSLYLPGIGLLSIPEEEQGMTYTICGDRFEALQSPDGALFIRHVGESDMLLLFESVTAISYDEVAGILYCVAPQEGKYTLYQYDPILRTVTEAGVLMDIPSGRMLAHAGVVYVLAPEGTLNAYTVATRQYEQIASLQAYALENPSLDYAAGNVLVYDAKMDADLFVTAVAVEAGAAQTPAQPSATEYTELRRGDEGTAVVRLQQRLIDLKYLVDEADGIFGPLTEEAVELLQGDLGLKEDGVASAEFQKRIFTTSIPALQLYDTLEEGDRGTNVRKMQQRLRDKQYLADAADGIFGARTEEAVRLYQAQNGFEETGAADEPMLMHLYSSAAPVCNTYIELQSGDSGTVVKNLNARLRELYYTSATASSNYTSDTVAAVKRFQKQLGERETGVATPELQRKLYSEYAPQYEGYTDHFAGETDERILSAQLQLSSLGYLRPDALTGTLDDLTAQAIRDFQYENNLNVDGILGANTQQALFAQNVSSAPSFLTDAQKSAMLGCVRTMLAGDWSDYDIISLLQQRLISLNYLSDKVTTSGIYNRLTYEAVKRLQLDRDLIDLSVSTANLGVADEKAVEALMDPAATPYTGTPAYYYN